MNNSVVMIGATGAVGSETVSALLDSNQLQRLTLLGRRPLQGVDAPIVEQHVVDVLTPDSYRQYLAGHDSAICTFGVGQPSKISKEDFVKIDKTGALHFAEECKAAGVQNFQLLSSIGASRGSLSFYLRMKGELEAAISDLGFASYSVFQPSMILTPNNRYGIMQAITLFAWPKLSPLFQGSGKKYRGIKVQTLGRAIALNTFSKNPGERRLTWQDFMRINASD